VAIIVKRGVKNVGYGVGLYLHSCLVDEILGYKIWGCDSIIGHDEIYQILSDS
jgi:hypothetical protein